MEDSWILAIGKEEMDQLFQDVPKLERLFRIITQRTLSVLQKRFFLTVSANAEERYEELIQRHAGIEQLVPQHQIASYLGILPESLSRMKKQLMERKMKK
jgi:CRP-like cAMP-binding protein